MSRTTFGLLTSLLICPATLVAGDREEPLITYGFRPLLSRVEVAPGAAFTLQIDLVLQTEQNPSDQGIQGFGFSMTGDGVDVIDVTADGTVSADIDDDPPGLVNTGFRIMEIGERGARECEGRVGALGAVVFSFIEAVTLPAEGLATIAKVTVAGEGPEEAAGVVPASIYYADGCGGAG